MKFYIPTKRLEEILKPAVKSASLNKTLQILTHVYIEVDDSEIKVVGANPEYTVSVKDKVDVSEGGRFLVLGDKFLQIVRSLPDGNVIIELSKDMLSLYVEGSSINFSIQTLPVEEYPKQILEVIETEYNFDISQKEMKKIINKLSNFCADDDSIQAVFTGFLFDLKDSGDITFVTTDTKRMGIYKTSYRAQDEASNLRFVVPYSTLEVLDDVLSSEGPLSVGVNFDEDRNVKNVVFSTNDMIISSSVIAGKFPEYEAIIPMTVENYAVINKRSLEEALKRISVISDKETKKVSFTFDDEELKLESENSILGSASEVVPCKFVGKREYIYFNYEFILDYLSVLDSEEFFWGFNHYESASKFWSEEEKEFLYIAMPLRR
ncbi:MAG: DNA polymerase III subunit beta [Brevinematia bacterium]